MRTLGIEAAPEDREREVNGEIARVRAQIAENTGIIADAEKKGKKEKTAQAALEKKRAPLETPRRPCRSRSIKLDTLTRSMNGLSGKATSLGAEFEKARSAALKDVEPFGIAQIASAELDADTSTS